MGISAYPWLPVHGHIKGLLGPKIPILCPISLFYLGSALPTSIPPLMSDELKGIPQTPMDPEKGTLDPLPVSTLTYNQDVKTPFSTLDVSPALLASKEKDSTVTTTTKEVVVAAKPKPAAKPKRKVSKWVLWRLWFNTYRYLSFLCDNCDAYTLERKFFTFTFGLNMIGLALAASGHWPYGVKYCGAIVVANFNFAILMRNEVFGRILYLVINTLFAKVGFYMAMECIH